MAKKKVKRKSRPIISGYLEKVGAKVFDDFSKVITDMIRGHQGIYALYKADKLREQLKSVLILFSIVNERLSSRAKYTVLKYLKMDLLKLEHIVDSDMYALGKLYLRIRRLRQDIAALRKTGRQPHQHRTETIRGHV